MKRHHVISGIALALAAALAIDAATSTQPSVEAPPPVITLFAPPPASADAKLAKMLKEVRFDKTPLRDALDWLRDETGLNLVVNWSPLSVYKIDRQTPISVILNDVTAAEALEVICREACGETLPRSMAFHADGNLVFVSTSDTLNRRTVTRIYDIADLLRLERTRRAYISNVDESMVSTKEEIIEDICRLIVDLVAPDVWREAGGSQGAIREFGGRLIVTQTPDCHRQIAELLDGLRSARVPITSPGTRPATRPVSSGLFGG